MVNDLMKNVCSFICSPRSVTNSLAAEFFNNLTNARAKTIRIAPLFDHGLSLLYSCTSDAMVKNFDVSEDKRCQNFIGGYSCYENLEFRKGRHSVFPNELKATDRDILFEGLDGILSEVFLDQIWNMIHERYRILHEKWMKG